MESFAAKHVTVAGLGRFGGGIAVTRWLCAQGAKVLVTDRDGADKLADSVRQLEGLNVELKLGEHREEDFTKADVVVASPAFPPDDRYLQAARGAGVAVTTEIRLFIERCGATIIGVTGTKGKSTTVSMLGRILDSARKTWVGGNIGKSLLGELEKIAADDLVVLELSSYMLAHLSEMRWSPHVAVVTTIAADHLQYHGSWQAYLEAKKNIFRHQTGDDYAVLNEEDPVGVGMAREFTGRKILYGVRNRKPFKLRLPGEHNQLNAQGAFTAAGIFGVDWDQTQKALADFAGLPHRLELVHEAGGVRYYNDSIATIPDAAVAAMNSFPAKKIIQIVGGYDKGLPITGLCAGLVERAKAVLCIGKTGEDVARVLEQSPSQHGAAAYRCGDLATAVKMARQIAAAGDVVLLSPGFASYDQFVNFEERGELFRRLVKS
jgi:UDP-N-acetylmuramoylalanine--D-glutamate ligase